MLVKHHFIPAAKVVTLSPEDSLKKALDLMEQQGHDALPILGEKNTLAGLISKQHIYKVFFTQDISDKETFISTTPVNKLMKTDFKYVYEEDLIEAAIKHMTTMRMQFIVVNNHDNRFAGILTRRILLETLANALGIDKKGVRVEVILNDIQGRLAAMTKVLAKSGYNIKSIFALDPHVMDLHKVVMRIDTSEEKPVVDLLNNAGFKVINSLLE